MNPTSQITEGVYTFLEQFRGHLINVLKVKTIFLKVLSDSFVSELQVSIVISMIEGGVEKFPKILISIPIP